MTIGEFLEMFDEHLHTTNLQTARVQTGATPKHLVYGLRGIQEILGCSHKSAQYYKDHVGYAECETAAADSPPCAPCPGGEMIRQTVCPEAAALPAPHDLEYIMYRIA